LSDSISFAILVLWVRYQPQSPVIAMIKVNKMITEAVTHFLIVIIFSIHLDYNKISIMAQNRPRRMPFC
jgi:hypothetical protein